MSPRLFASSLLAVAAVSCSPAPDQQSAPDAEIIAADEAIPGEYVVALSPDVSGAELDAVIADLVTPLGVAPRHVFRSVFFGFSVALSKRSDAVAIASDPRIAYVEENGKVRIAELQTDAPWGLDRIDQQASALDSAYTFHSDGQGVAIYVVDTGVRASHQSFGPRVETGHSVLGGSAAQDCHGHGTHVAAVAASTSWGVAKGAKIIPVRVVGCNGEGTSADLIAGLDWIATVGQARSVANVSVSAGRSRAVDEAAAALYAAGIAVVAAAGNDGKDACGASPAREPVVLAVAASNRSDELATFSNAGACVDLVAPGEAIAGADAAADSAATTRSGTSAAAAHVAGAVALYFGEHATASVEDVTASLVRNATTGALRALRGAPDRLLYSRYVGAPPRVDITTPAMNATVANAITVTAVASDADSDVTQVRFGWPDGTFATDASPPYQAIWDTSTFGNGPVTIFATASSSDGSSSTTSVDLTITNSTGNRPPTIAFTAPGTGTTVSGQIALAVNAADPDGTVTSVRFDLPDGSAVIDVTAPYAMTWDTETIANGAHVLRATVTDVGGATATAMATVTVANANPPPSMQFLAPIAGSTVSGSKLVLVSARDNDGVASVRFELPDGTSFTDTGDSPFDMFWNTTRTPDGLRTIRAIATDGTGRAATATITVRVANGVNFPPTVAVTAPAAGATVGGVITVAATASDPEGALTSVRFTLPDGTSVVDNVAPYSTTWNTATRPNAARTITATALDAAGATTTSAVTFNVYNGGLNYEPSVTVTAPRSTDTHTGVVVASATAVDYDGSVAWVRFDFPDGTSVVDRAAPYEALWNTATVASGGRSLYVTAADNLGKETTVSHYVATSNLGANLHPSVSIVTPLATVEASGDIVIGALATDLDGTIAQVRFELPDGTSVIDTTAPYGAVWASTRVANGERTIRATATDNLGATTRSEVVVRVANTAVGDCSSGGTYAASGLPMPIPDGNTTGITSSVTIENPGTVSTLSLSLLIRHGARGDLSVILQSPTGTYYNVWSFEGGSTDDLVLANVPVVAFRGQRLGGQWKLHVVDRTSIFTGTLESWSLTVTSTCARPPQARGGRYVFAAENTASAASRTASYAVYLQAGTKISFGTCDLVGASFNGDTYVRLQSANGSTVVENNDACGGTGSLASYTAAFDGVFQLRAGCSGASACSGTLAWTLEGSATFTATATQSARVATVNRYVHLGAGQTVVFGTCGMPGASFGDTDTFLRFVAPDGAFVAAGDNACGFIGSKLSAAAPADGVYELRMGCRDNASCGGTAKWIVQ